jgi:hypothetical protein
LLSSFLPQKGVNLEKIEEKALADFFCGLISWGGFKRIIAQS